MREQSYCIRRIEIYLFRLLNKFDRSYKFRISQTKVNLIKMKISVFKITLAFGYSFYAYQQTFLNGVIKQFTNGKAA